MQLHQVKRGRPVLPQTTKLMNALIRSQDALARRRARQIADLERRYVDEAEVERVGQESAALIRASLLQVPSQVAGAIAATSDAAAVYSLLDGALRAALTRAADQIAAAAPDEPEPVRPRLRPSKSLAEARARNAALRADLIALEERCHA